MRDGRSQHAGGQRVPGQPELHRERHTHRQRPATAARDRAGAPAAAALSRHELQRKQEPRAAGAAVGTLGSCVRRNTAPEAVDRLTLFDAMLRMLAIGQLVLIAVVVGRGSAPRAIRLATAVLLLGVACYLTIATPMFRPLRGPFWAAVQFTAQAVPLELWIFTHLLFERPIDRRVVLAGFAMRFGCWAGYYFATI
eukprot:gene23401-30326_t